MIKTANWNTRSNDILVLTFSNVDKSPMCRDLAAYSPCYIPLLDYCLVWQQRRIAYFIRYLHSVEQTCRKLFKNTDKHSHIKRNNLFRKYNLLAYKTSVNMCRRKQWQPNECKCSAPRSVTAVKWMSMSASFQKIVLSLTHWGRDEITAILQTSFSKAFSWTEIYKFILRCHWILSPRVKSTIFQHWLR